MLETRKVDNKQDTQCAFRKPTSIISNRYALLRRIFWKWVCRSIYSSEV